MAALLLGNLTDPTAIELVNRRVTPDSMPVERLAEESSNLASMAYYFGKTNFVQVGASLMQPNTPPHRVNYNVNLIIGSVQRAVSKIMSAKGKPHVIPEAIDRRGLQVAKVSKRVLEHHLIPISKYERRKRLAYMWAAICGSAWMKTYWNPNKGEVNRWYLDDDRLVATKPFSPEEQRRRENAGLYEDIPLGEVEIGVVNPFQAFYDLDARQDMDDCEWFAQQQFMSRERVTAMFGAKYKDVTAGGRDWQSQQFMEAIAFMQTGIQGQSRGPSTVSHDWEDIVRVVEMWERPSALNGKKGRRILVIGDKVAFNGANPHCWSKDPALHLPFVKVDWWTMPGKFKGVSMVEQMRNAQYNLNRARAAKIEHQNVHGQPALFVDKNSGIPAGSLSNLAGQVWEINQTARPPMPAPTPTLPKEVAENEAMCRLDLQSLAADAAPQMESMPSAIRSSSALRMMLQEQNAVLSPTADMAFAADEQIGRNLLALAQHHYDMPRTLRYVGDDGDYMVQAFMGSDLNSDLRILGKPDTTFSDASARSEIMDLVQMGGLDPVNNPNDKSYMLHALEMDSTDDLKQKKMRGELTQEKEIQRIISHPQGYGQAAGYPAKEWEPHADHIRVLVDFMQTQEFEQLDPAVQALIEQHWKQHQVFMDIQLQAIQAISSPPSGAPKPPGKASQPKPK